MQSRSERIFGICRSQVGFQLEASESLTLGNSFLSASSLVDNKGLVYRNQSRFCASC
jgi:hypothetical protein